MISASPAEGSPRVLPSSQLCLQRTFLLDQDLAQRVGFRVRAVQGAWVIQCSAVLGEGMAKIQGSWGSSPPAVWL